MTRQTVRIAGLGVQIFIIGVFGAHRAVAQVQPSPRVGSPVAALPPGSAPVVESGSEERAVQLLVGRSTLVDIGEPISRVSLTSSTIADALVTSSNQLLVHGKQPGSISMFVWNRGGAVKRYEIVVQRDLAALSEQMRQLFPGEPIQVHANGKQVVLAGKVSSKDVAEKAISVAAGYVEKKEDVVTLLAAQPGPISNQVMLRVRFAEVSRSAMTEFGMSLFTSPTGANNNIGRVTTQQFSAPNMTDLAWSKVDTSFGSDVTSASGKINFADFLNVFLLNQKYDIGLLIKALQNRGLFQSLAEPNLVAESGKEASFLAGGEFPIPVVQGTASNAAVSVDFKEFGVRLNFTPTVKGDRVHLKIRPEVSTLDYGNAVVLNGFRIPALSTRRTETELELRDGQTFAVAGLMNNQMQSTLQKIPGIGDIPILGHLFRSRAAQKNQTELVVMITPEILRENSTGVTPDLPRLPEEFMPPLSEKGTRPAPPAAFTPQSRSLAAEPQKPVTRTAEQALPEGSVQSAAPAGGQAAQAGSAQQAVTDARQQAGEQRRLEAQAREQAKRDAKAAEKARKEMERLAKEQAKRDAKAAKEQAKRDAQAAKEKARREAEAAKDQAKAGQTPTPVAEPEDVGAAASDRENEDQLSTEAVAERLRAAEADYQAELARRSER